MNMDNFGVAGATTATFGTVTGLKVSLRGAGRALSLSANGNLIRLGANQTMILRGLTLQGQGSGVNNANGMVYVNGTNSVFTMQSGKIFGNESSTSTSNGGGVYVAGNFRIITGTVYGSNEANTSLKNTATSGAALQTSGTAQHGTLNGTTWTSKGTLDTTNNTIRVQDGEMQ
jgi:hypothetical protein